MSNKGDKLKIIGAIISSIGSILILLPILAIIILFLYLLIKTM